MTKKTHIKEIFLDQAKIDPNNTATDKTSLEFGLDIDYYQAFLDDVDISDDQKTELVETLWQIVVNFVELGFKVHPLNSVQDSATKDETAIALERVLGDFASDALDVLNTYEDSEIIEAISAQDETGQT
ncbi:hypothetical protein [Lentilitoribacter sp. EG35]|uniref:hypothetical protein n=1 Tax=Lentilitoribacter sp. EG35 TaxID=3234192 RepID=UPI00345F8242